MGEAQPAGGQATATARRFRLASPGIALALGVLTLVLFALDVPLGFAAHGGGGGLGAAALLVGILGLVVARRQPANPIGWLLLGYGAAGVFYDVASKYAVLDYHFHHGDLPAGPAAALPCWALGRGTWPARRSW